MRLWLTRQANELYMLTKLKPIKEKVMGSNKEDVYIIAGEPIGVRNLCSVIADLVGCKGLEIGESIQIELNGRILNGGST